MDLARDTGLHRMIDRIEMLRDDADARDTRIRLVPDALGPVEVSVRRDGDAVRIHFTAEQAATRALIADAQPRLGELAEARGVKISQASVDTGTAGDGRARQQPAPTTQSSATPRRVDSEPDNSSDDRIA
jgi:flagellar hook-length control protein FliK